MNIEQRMATPIPKFADCGQDMTSYEVLRLEQLLLEFGQRDSPSPQAPVTRPPLTRKLPQSYIEGVDDADKRPRLQWRKKEERDQSGRFASWTGSSAWCAETTSSRNWDAYVIGVQATTTSCSRISISKGRLP